MLESDVYTEHIRLLPRIVSIVVSSIPIDSSLRVHINSILLERGPVAEILSGEIDPDLVYAYLSGEFHRNGIAHSKILESQIADILKITGVYLRQRP